MPCVYFNQPCSNWPDRSEGHLRMDVCTHLRPLLEGLKQSVYLMKPASNQPRKAPPGGLDDYNATLAAGPALVTSRTAWTSTEL